MKIRFHVRRPTRLVGHNTWLGPLSVAEDRKKSGWGKYSEVEARVCCSEPAGGTLPSD